MKILVAVLAIFYVTNITAAISIISRSEWGGRTTNSTSHLARGLDYVVIHHLSGDYCNTTATCSEKMLVMQSFHMDALRFPDIGFNYVIGGDGKIYEGCGADVMGSYAKSWNSKKYSIGFFDNYRYNNLTTAQIAKAKKLIGWFVTQGYIASNYTLLDHDQVRAALNSGSNLDDDNTYVFII